MSTGDVQEHGNVDWQSEYQGQEAGKTKPFKLPSPVRIKVMYGNLHWVWQNYFNRFLLDLSENVQYTIF
jgi:hypothetical protein